MHKVVIASDSFKGSLSSAEVAEAACNGIHDIYPDCTVLKVCMADGGEGMLSAIEGNMPAERMHAEVHDAIGRNVTAEYLIHEKNGTRTAIIEMAKASGLTLLKDNERNPLITSSYGTGELIMDAFGRGCSKFIIGLGGSATNDGGSGMLEAIGVRFYDNTGNELMRLDGSLIGQISSIDMSFVTKDLLECEFVVACDVDATFTGPEGASYVFSAQKGADIRMTEELETGMMRFSEAIDRTFGSDISSVKGSGAAGGLGGALHIFLGAELKKGSELILDTIGFDSLIEDADLVITGEGRIDNQTFMGKVPAGVAERAARYGIPVIAIGGIIDIQDVPSGFQTIIPIGKRPENAEELRYAMIPSVSKERIRKTISDYFLNIFIKNQEKILQIKK